MVQELENGQTILFVCLRGLVLWKGMGRKETLTNLGLDTHTRSWCNLAAVCVSRSVVALRSANLSVRFERVAHMQGPVWAFGFSTRASPIVVPLLADAFPVSYTHLTLPTKRIV